MVFRLVTKLLEGHQPKGEPSLAWLPAYSYAKRRPRVRHFHIPAGGSMVVRISLHRFSTRPDESRSGQTRQLVMRVHFHGFREAVITAIPRATAQPVFRFSRSLATSLLLVLAGLLGGIYFGAQLTGPPQLYVENSPESGTQDISRIRDQSPLKIKQVDVGFNYSSVSRTRPAQTQKIIVHKPKVMSRSLPVRLIIPEINIDTGILPIGLRPAGDIAMPDSFQEVGWYDQSPTPGQLGPSVIVGHLDSIYGIAVFWRLSELVPGDTFQVVRADGSTATFKVLEVEQFAQNAFPTANVYGNIKYAGIRLITCSGTFDFQTRHYDHNTVVYGALQ